MYNNIKCILIQYIIIRIIGILLILRNGNVKEFLDKNVFFWGGVNSNLVNKQEKEYKRRLGI